MSHFVFGPRSLANLATVDPRLRDVLDEAIRLSPVDFAVLTGHRDRAAQERAFAAGRSKVHWPDGKHNATPSRAVDLAPWPIDWADELRFALLAGVVFSAARLEDVEVRWGGDFNRDGRTADEGFRDLGHFELVD